MKRLTVLNTRPAEQAAELSRLLSDAGFDVVEAPAIAVEPTWDRTELAAVRNDLAAGAFTWVVLASPNAGRELKAELQELRERVVCGAATARALGLDAATTLERFSAANALQLLQARVQRGDRALVPRAAAGRDEILDGLLALGVAVEAPVVYRTVPVSNAAARLARGGVDILVLCSPSAAESVAHAVRPGTLVACLGSTTAQAAQALGLRVDAVAQQTSVRSLVGAIESVAGAQV